MTHKIAVFTGDLSYSVCAGIAEIDRAVAEIEWLVLLHSPRKTIAALIGSQRRNLRRNGWRWVHYQIGDVVRRIGAQLRSSASLGSPRHTAQSLAPGRNLRILRSNDIHDEVTLAEVRKFAPDLGLSLAAPILRESLFSLPRLGTLNLHKGKLPQYRGMPPAFWELWNEEKEVGCTIHWVESKLDAGPVVVESTVQRERFSTVRGLQLRLDEVGVDLMRTAVRRILSGERIGYPQPTNGRTNRKPTLAQTAELTRRLARDVVFPGSFPQRIARETMYAAARSCLPIARLSMRPRITVLLYHRVSDEARDNLTVGIEQFDRQMALIRRHCDLLTLEEVLACDTIPTSTRPQVCVTFDDGYLDNFINAFPILRRNAIPAAFFVSTGIIGTDRPFPHDVRRGGSRPPVMTWENVKKMHDYGFTIGSHSVSHIDCVKEPESAVVEELTRSRADLERRLGLAEVYFAYPFGGRQHMNAQRLDLVRAAGYAACLSAYGGSNIGVVDRYNVLRGGINWEFSDRAFLFRCQGIR
ncbi:MAG: polysaccharide deacetylase family protein [Betaproteobacteria bacterium]